MCLDWLEALLQIINCLLDVRDGYPKQLVCGSVHCIFYFRACNCHSHKMV